MTANELAAVVTAYAILQRAAERRAPHDSPVQRWRLAARVSAHDVPFVATSTALSRWTLSDRLRD